MTTSGLRGPRPRKVSERRGDMRGAIGAAARRDQCEQQLLHSYDVQRRDDFHPDYSDVHVPHAPTQGAAADQPVR